MGGIPSLVHLRRARWALAGILPTPVAIEFGIKTGYVLHAAIGLFSLFVVPDKEMSLIFVFFLALSRLLPKNRAHCSPVRPSGPPVGCV